MLSKNHGTPHTLALREQPALASPLLQDIHPAGAMYQMLSVSHA